MIVTKIQPVTKQKFEIHIDGQLAFVLYRGELFRYKIREGEEIEQKNYNEIVQVVLVKRAKLRAMHLLQKMDRTEQDLRVKLGKNGYPGTAIDIAIDYVKSYGYINDKEYARKYIECGKQTKGSLRLHMELSQKGVPKELTAEILEEINQEDQKEVIRSLLKKKRKGTGPLDEKEVRRLYGYLARRGFSSKDIWNVMKEEKNLMEEYPY